MMFKINISKFKKENIESCSQKNQNYIDLTPVSNADPDGSYSNALHYAFKNNRIKNIALTGPYGSGKSSIIRTFEKNSKYKFLNISLASFSDESQNDGNKNINILIERSILQQMLYGADANSLPYSRFKRIITPDHPLIKSLLFVFWMLLTLFIYYHKVNIINYQSFNLLWLSKVFIASYVVSMPIVLLSDFYKLSFGISFRKISLTNAEIETGELSENSILNRHLDEIIYFFQETQYDAVVIEDLDRFGSPEIFVKLREINKLINDNNKTRGKIKFVYALKDDMFSRNDRAKFFDFIIPVVPIINSSNSLEKMHSRIKHEPFEDFIDFQFLREVSLYIDDLRLIHNIFNELIIYYKKLDSKNLDITKLLAMMIYKNTYPNDFEKLHHGKGVLFEVCVMREDLLEKNKIRLKLEIGKLKGSIEAANNEKITDINELIKVYIGHMVSMVNQPVIGIVCNNEHIKFSDMISWGKFEKLFNDENVHLATNLQSHYSYRIATNKSFSQIESEINPNETFIIRKNKIEITVGSKLDDINAKIKSHEMKISELPFKKLHEILNHNEVSIESIVGNSGIQDGKLLVYLIRNGYLDENYHIYTSIFHEGRLTKVDREFLLAIRNFIQPDPKQRIDNPEEVCKNMRYEDFGHKYVLNVKLIDYLLERRESNFERIASAIRYISSNFKESEEFFESYYTSGKKVCLFIKILSEQWTGLSKASIDSTNAPEHINWILKCVDKNHIALHMNNGNIITQYISEHANLIFLSETHAPIDFNILIKLDVRLYNLSSIKKNNELIDFLHINNLYTITIENICFLIKHYSMNIENIELLMSTQNYTTITKNCSEYLRKYIYDNINIYVDNVFLLLPENISESEDVVKVLINDARLDGDIKRKIIAKEEQKFSNFKDIPADLWEYVISEEKIDISWKNISEYLINEECSKNIINEILERGHVLEKLCQSKIDIATIGDELCKKISSFILNNNIINDETYRRLINKIPYRYTNFPVDISVNKRILLAQENKITLNAESFKIAESSQEILFNLIVKNIDEFCKNKQIYKITDELRAELLDSKINEKYKAIVIQDITPDYVKANTYIAKSIADILSLLSIVCTIYSDEVVLLSIINARNIQISINILSKCIPFRGKDWLTDVLKKLPAPFNEIAVYGRRPKLENTPENRNFARLLVDEGFVSSAKEESKKIRINTFKSSDHLEK